MGKKLCCLTFNQVGLGLNLLLEKNQGLINYKKFSLLMTTLFSLDFFSSIIYPYIQG
jgi:hypothetical protein